MQVNTKWMESEKWYSFTYHILYFSSHKVEQTDLGHCLPSQYCQLQVFTGSPSRQLSPSTQYLCESTKYSPLFPLLKVKQLDQLFFVSFTKLCLCQSSMVLHNMCRLSTRNHRVLHNMCDLCKRAYKLNYWAYMYTVCILSPTQLAYV